METDKLPYKVFISAGSDVEFVKRQIYELFMKFNKNYYKYAKINPFYLNSWETNLKPEFQNNVQNLIFNYLENQDIYIIIIGKKLDSFQDDYFNEFIKGINESKQFWFINAENLSNEKSENNKNVMDFFVKKMNGVLYPLGFKSPKTYSDIERALGREIEKLLFDIPQKAIDKISTQSSLARHVGLNATGQLTYIVTSPEEALDDTPVQRGAYDDLLELKNTLCGYSHNQLGSFLTPLIEKLTKAMPERIEEARKSPLWRVMNRLRITLAAHTQVKDENEPSDARLNANVASTLSMLIEEYNIFAMGDSGLRLLDEQKPGPQEREKTYQELLKAREIVQGIAKSQTMATDDLRADITDILNETLVANPDLNQAQRQEQDKHTLSNVIATALTSIYYYMKKHLNGEGGFASKEVMSGFYKTVGAAKITAIGGSALYVASSFFGMRYEILQLIISQADLIKLYYAASLPEVNVGRVIEWLVINSKEKPQK